LLRAELSSDFFTSLHNIDFNTAEGRLEALSMKPLSKIVFEAERSFLADNPVIKPLYGPIITFLKGIFGVT